MVPCDKCITAGVRCLAGAKVWLSLPLPLHSVTRAGIVGMTIAHYFCVEFVWKSAVVAPQQAVQEGPEARLLTR